MTWRKFYVLTSKGWLTFDQISSSNDVISSQAKEVVSSSLQKLASYGVVKTTGSNNIMFNTNPVGLWYVSRYSITPTGKKFVKFIVDT